VPQLLGMPKPGTCWRLPPEPVGRGHWFDASPEVPCTSGHTTQTASAFTVPEPTVAMARQVTDDCWERARGYIGVDLDHWIPWRVLVFLPSREQVAKGASWVRCDVGIPVHPSGSQLVPVSRSVEGAALDPPVDLRGCSNAMPLARSRLTWHHCRSRHRFESSGTLTVLRGLTAYPSRTVRDRQGTRQCRHDLTRQQRRRGLAARAVWDSPRDLADEQLVGACWAYDPAGGWLPPAA
jgi:hypothetical protein